MTETGNPIRIDEPVFKGITGSLFALAILSAIIRMVYRVQSHGRLLLDDFIFIFACMTLTAANGILFSMIPTVYWDLDLILNPSSVETQMAHSPAAFMARVLRYQRMVFSFLTLTWTTIFAVKICFLLFFLQIVDRLKKFMFLWKIVFGITMLFYGFCACGIFIACPHFVPTCAQGTGFTINLAFSASEIALDVTTDLLVIMIPILLLWNVKIKRSQKILLGIFLCLSTTMIVINIVRISGLRIRPRNIDVHWALFWQEIEATIAVIMVSITAVRSLLGLKVLKSREQKARWYSDRRNFLMRKANKKSESELNDHQLPSVPGATLTGTRTFIRANSGSKMVASRVDAMSASDDRVELEQQIQVTQKISSESETKSKDGVASAASIV